MKRSSCTVTIISGETTRPVQVQVGALLGDVIAGAGLALEQPCAGRGTCGLCKVLVEWGSSPPDEIESVHLTPGELALDNRLACRVRVRQDMRVVLSPIVVYSNKIFRSSTRYRRQQTPLGLAIDLGSTTVAAFLTSLEDGEVYAGAAGLNQQAVYGADVISRIAAARHNPENAERLHRLALASINHAVDALMLSDRIRSRIDRVIIVCNVAMHHLLSRLPVDNLAEMPFQPLSVDPIEDASSLMDGIFPPRVKVSLPPLIGGFVGSDALACLAYFGFDQAHEPILAVDLGTNGEVMLTDGSRILTASTAAGPAFEGVNISCGTRAVNGAIVAARIVQDDLALNTIAGEPPVGLTGTGLLSVVHALRSAGLVEKSGRLVQPGAGLASRIRLNAKGWKKFMLTSEDGLSLTQWDIRELQKAKGAIRAAIDVLMNRLRLAPQDLSQVILTGSFGGQIDIHAAVELGLIPPVDPEKIKTIPNGAGLGAAMFLNDRGFAHAARLARRAEQVDLDKDDHFHNFYVNALALAPVLQQVVG